MSFGDIKMGIDRPPSLDDQLKIYSDVRAMRKAITMAQRDSALVRMAMRLAENNGLSSEELYVTLAYHALCQLEVFWQDRLKLAALSIPPLTMAADQPAS